MTSAWKFSLNLDSGFTTTEMHHRVGDLLVGISPVEIKGDDIYISKLDDAFTFRMRAGNMVDSSKVTL